MNFDLTNALAVLERTPGTLHTMLAGLTPAWINATEGPDTWSPYDVVGHLIHGDHVNAKRAEFIMKQGEDGKFVSFDRAAQFRDSEGKSLSTLLDEFANLRTANVAHLREWKLTDIERAQQGEHPVFGLVTLRQLLSTWVAHDLAHIAQIARVMAKQYRDDVGPWREYLAIMDR